MDRQAVSTPFLDLHRLKLTDLLGEERGVVHLAQPQGAALAGDDLTERGRAVAGRRGGDLHALDEGPGGAEEMRPDAEHAIHQGGLIGAGALLAVDLLVAGIEIAEPRRDLRAGQRPFRLARRLGRLHHDLHARARHHHVGGRAAAHAASKAEQDAGKAKSTNAYSLHLAYFQCSQKNIIEIMRKIYLKQDNRAFPDQSASYPATAK